MFSPGQLIRQQRNRRGWTQNQLAEASGVAQGRLSSYESGQREPTWSQLCRILAVMGLQPRAVAEACDLNQHAATALVRSSFDELYVPERLDGVRQGRSIDVATIMRPDLTHEALNLRHIRPVCQLMDGLEHVFVGRFALREHGIGCAVPAIDVLVASSTDAAGGDDTIWSRLSGRISATATQIWCPILSMYTRNPSEVRIHEIAELTFGSLTFRTRETATEIRMRVVDEELPPHVFLTIRDLRLPLLNLSEFRGDPELARLIERFAGSLSEPGGPD